MMKITMKPWLIASAICLASSLSHGGHLWAIDVCGDGICNPNARPPETCSVCPDDCGVCPPPPEFADLVDPSDGVPGRLVVPNTAVYFTWSSQANFGQERNRALQLALAVDPTNSSRVYIAWADYIGTPAVNTLHVRRSDDRGVTWTTDLLTVPNAMNPALAVNSVGKVAFLYQLNTPIGAPLANQKWQTHVRRSANLGGAWDDAILSRTAAGAPVATSMPYLGDRLWIQAVGKNFHGMFTASNVPDPAAFPNGVVYQRKADWKLKQLLHPSGLTFVAPSIDPFYFRLTEP
jgi:hypothetical protein